MKPSEEQAMKYPLTDYSAAQKRNEQAYRYLEETDGTGLSSNALDMLFDSEFNLEAVSNWEGVA